MKVLDNRPRLKLVLGKFPVARVIKTPWGFAFSLTLPGIKEKLVISVPDHADVREGDLLTLYTEVLTNAPSQPTSEQ